MRDDRKKLDQLNKVIAKGRVKTALHFALAIFIGVGISKFFLGQGIQWLFFQSWITFLVSFLFGFLIGRNSDLKAARIIDRIGGDESDLAKPPTTNRGSWIIFVLILSVLLSPTLFRKQIAGWAKQSIQESSVDLKVISEDGEETRLKIPHAYIMKNYNLRMGLFPTEIPRLTIAATLDTLEPVKNVRAVHTPKNNKNVIALELKNQRYEIDKNFLDKVLRNILSKNIRNETISHDYGLEITSAEILTPVSGKKKEKFINIKIAMPLEKRDQNIFVACEDTICALISNFDEISVIYLYFHPSQLSAWRDIYDKSETLLRRFIVSSAQH